MPAIDVSEKEGFYLVKAELPGVARENRDVTINDGVLTINAERKEEKKDERDDRVIRQERYYGKFVRSLRLGSDIDEGRIEAQYEDGVLKLSLPKTAEVKPRKVDIKVGLIKPGAHRKGSRGGPFFWRDKPTPVFFGGCVCLPGKGCPGSYTLPRK